MVSGLMVLLVYVEMPVLSLGHHSGLRIQSCCSELPYTAAGGSQKREEKRQRKKKEKKSKEKKGNETTVERKEVI